MKHREAHRAHINLTTDCRSTLDRLVRHLRVAYPGRRVTASSAVRYAIEKTAGTFEAAASL